MFQKDFYHKIPVTAPEPYANTPRGTGMLPEPNLQLSPLMVVGQGTFYYVVFFRRPPLIFLTLN